MNLLTCSLAYARLRIGGCSIHLELTVRWRPSVPICHNF